MALSKDRIIALGTTPHLHEQAAINFVLATLPDRDPFRLWGLIDLVDPAGRRYDLDLLVIGFHALYLIEIKSHPGKIKGDVVDWEVTFPDGGRTTLENPSRLAEYKARVLASLLQKRMEPSSQPPPWVQHLIFLSDKDVKVDLAGAAGNHVVTQANFVRALQFGEYPGATAQSTRREINHPQAREIVRALQSMGLRPSHASRKVGDLVLGKLLVEHENYQDHLARHESIPTLQARVRTYHVAQGTTLERRKQLTSAADREARHLTLLSDHPNILKLKNYVAHGPTDSPCIVFEHLDGALPLDAFLRAHPDLTLDQKVNIVTHVGEALAYCHRKSVLHRGVAPSSVLVRQNPDVPSKIDVRLFNFQVATPTESATGTAHYTSHLTAWRGVNEDVYVAPEVLENPQNATAASDLFSLGAVTYLILVGRPPGQSVSEREALLKRGYLSPATAGDEFAPGRGGTRVDVGPTTSDAHAAVTAEIGAASDLEAAMEFATDKNPINRGNDVAWWLGQFMEAVTTPAPVNTKSYVDPLEAKPNDSIAPEVLVEAVLGSGSTARTLRIHTEDGTFALKVSHSPEFDSRLRQEGEVLRALQKDGRPSEHIVRLHEVMQIAGRVALRLTDAGQTLARLLAEEGPPSIDYAKRWGQDLLGALDYIEERGVQHRDIKPANLGVLSADQKRKRHLLLFDFSLSAADPGATRLGTPVYRDPFLQQRGRWDEAADRYAAAVTLHEVLTGERPRWGSADIASATTEEITLSAERFDATVRDRLLAFFRRALARDLSKRFPTADEMRTEWVACFAATAPALPATGVDTADDLLPAESTSSRTAPLPERLTLQTATESLPLSARAKNGLYRNGVLNVADLLRLPNNRLSAMRGVGRTTSREILDFIQRPEWQPLREQLEARFSTPAPTLSPSSLFAAASAPTASPGTTAPAGPPPASGVGSEGLGAAQRGDAAGDGPGDGQGPPPPRTLAAWGDAALPSIARSTGKTGKRSGEKSSQYVRYLWGLDQLQGRTVDSVAELAALLGVTRPLIYQALDKMRQRWRTLPFLDDLRAVVRTALEQTAGHAPLGMLAEALAQALDRSQAVGVGVAAPNPRAAALVRVAVETDESLLLVRIPRRPGRQGKLWVIPADGDVPGLERLGSAADDLGRKEPLLSPGGAMEHLKATVADSALLAGLPGEILVALAVAASAEAARSARLEIYPRGLPAARALDLCVGALPPENLDPAAVSQIVQARYPDAAPLPAGQELNDLLLQRGYTHDAQTGKFNRRVHTPEGETLYPVVRADTTHTAHRAQIDPEAREFARDIEVRQKRGSFCVLEVPAGRARATAEELERRLAVAPISIESVLLKWMDAFMTDQGIDADIVLAADRAGPAGGEWPNLKQLMVEAAKGAYDELTAQRGPLVLTDPGLLARYGLGDFLKKLVVRSRADDTPAVFLIVPAADEAGGGVRIVHPVGDLPIPLTSPAQHLRVPETWLENLDRGGPRPFGPPVQAHT